MAEWLGSALQKLLQRFESAFDLLITYYLLTRAVLQPFCYVYTGEQTNAENSVLR